MILSAVIIYVLAQKLYTAFWYKNLYARISFSKDHAVKGEQVILEEIVCNNKWLPVPFLHVKFQIDRNLQFVKMDQTAVVSDKGYKNDMFSLLFYQKITRKIPVLCSKRGYYKIDTMDVVSMGLCMNDILSFNAPTAAAIVVYPKPADADRIEVPYKRLLGGMITKQYTYEDPFTFKGIRDYYESDPMSAVNWKAYAKTSELKVNMKEFTAGQEVYLLLNIEQDGMQRYERLQEESISIVAGLLDKFERQGIATGLISNGIDGLTGETLYFPSGLGLEHRRKLNFGLARIDLQQEDQEFSEILSRKIGREKSNALFLMVSTCKREPLKNRFNSICKMSGKSVWIVPHYSDMDWMPQNCPRAEIISWEVTPYAE